MKQGPTYFEPLADLCVAGYVGIHIDRTFRLDEVPDALAYVGEGRALGKVVIEFDWRLGCPRHHECMGGS